jgi:hypothetical protein
MARRAARRAKQAGSQRSERGRVEAEREHSIRSLFPLLSLPVVARARERHQGFEPVHTFDDPDDPANGATCGSSRQTSGVAEVRARTRRSRARAQHSFSTFLCFRYLWSLALESGIKASNRYILLTTRTTLRRQTSGVAEVRARTRRSRARAQHSFSTITKSLAMLDVPD